MKARFPHFAIFFGIWLWGAFSSAQEAVIPAGFGVDRYASLWEHSPFTIASVQQDATPAGFAEKLALVGVAKIGTENLATVINKDSQERISVSSKPNDQGWKLIAVDSDPDLLKVVATIQSGNETAKVRFDPALIAASAQPQPQPPPPNVGHPPPSIGGVPPPAPSVVPVRRVRHLPVIPQPSTMPVVPSYSQPPGHP